MLDLILLSSAGHPLPESRPPDLSHIYISNAGSSNSNKCFRIPEALVEDFVREYTLWFLGMFQSHGHQGLRSISICVTNQNEGVVYDLADKTLVFPNRRGAKDYMVGFEYNIFTTAGHEEEIIRTIKLNAFGRSDLEKYAVPGVDKYK